MAFSFSGGSAENIRPRPPLREDFAVIREEPNLRIAFSGDSEEEYEVERVDADGSATVVGSSSSPDILVPSQAQEHRVVAKNKELGIRGTPSVPKRELKPDHRWQMPLPRNLLDDPESFDPANTAWRVQNGLAYDGVTPNVGPNGEDADTFTFPGDSFTALRVLPTVNTVTTGGFYLRVDSGSKNLVLVTREQDNTIHTNNSSIGTSWRWLSLETPNDIGLLRLQSNDLDAATVYILRAVLNRGSSRLFSTRSQVPQTIPDVVQGADLSNGSTDSPDTNDLDFGVDDGGVPYAVSGGDDKLSKIPSSILGDQTWIWSIRAPDGGYTERFTTGRIKYFDWGVQPGSGAPNIFLNVETEDGLQEVEVEVTFPFDGAVAISIDRDAGEARLNVEGTVKKIQFSEIARGDISDWIPWVENTGGIRLSHLEAHPVLTEAEAEAVRQRLAGNPPDPVPPTEAWDFSAETSPHNLALQSEKMGGSEWSTRQTSVNTDAATDPKGGSSADEIIEDSSDSFHNIDQRTNVDYKPGIKYTFSVWLKANTRDWGSIFLLNNITPSGEQWAAYFDLNNGVVGNLNNPNAGSGEGWTNATISERGNGWYKCSATVVLSNIGRGLTGVGIHNGNGNLTYQGDGSSSIYAWGFHSVRGDVKTPTYVQTGSIAFPQTVPALRDSSNDLTLGSSSGADTNDPDWVAPVGVATDGDDRLDVPPETLTQEATWTHAFRQIGSKLQFRVGPVKLKDKFNINIAIQDVNGSLYTLSSSGVIFDDNKHVYTLVYSEAKRIVRLYLDGNIVFDVDLDADTSLGPLDLDAYTNFLDFSAGAAVHENLIHYSRVLTPEEIAYDAERLLDNPEDPFPNYTTP